MVPWRVYPSSPWNVPIEPPSPIPTSRDIPVTNQTHEIKSHCLALAWDVETSRINNPIGPNERKWFTTYRRTPWNWVFFASHQSSAAKKSRKKIKKHHLPFVPYIFGTRNERKMTDWCVAVWCVAKMLAIAFFLGDWRRHLKSSMI